MNTITRTNGLPSMDAATKREAYGVMHHGVTGQEVEGQWWPAGTEVCAVTFGRIDTNGVQHVMGEIEGYLYDFVRAAFGPELDAIDPHW